MLFQVNYKFVNDHNKLRSASHIEDAKDVKDARAKAITALKADHDRFEITSIKPFGNQTP